MTNPQGRDLQFKKINERFFSGAPRDAIVGPNFERGGILGFS